MIRKFTRFLTSDKPLQITLWVCMAAMIGMTVIGLNK